MKMSVKKSAGKKNGPNKAPSKPVSGDIWWANNLPFEGSVLNKGRPVLVIGRDGDCFMCLKCTTSGWPYVQKQYRIMDAMSAGLEKDTYLDMEPVRVPGRLLERRMGELSEEDCENLNI